MGRPCLAVGLANAVNLALNQALAAAKPLVTGSAAVAEGAAASEDEDASEAHSVMQRGVGAVAAALSSKAAPVAVHVEYKGAVHTVHALASLTGLMLKSAVIAELGLAGGFQDYYLRLDGAPFGSRTPIRMHPGFRSGCTLVLEDVGERPKAVGMT